MLEPILNKWITKAAMWNQITTKTTCITENRNRPQPAQQTVNCSNTCIPAHKFKPMEAVIEGIVSCQSALAVLLVRGGHFSSTVIHLSHLVQPLPANDDRVHFTLMGSRKRIYGSRNGWKEGMQLNVSLATNLTKTRTRLRSGTGIT